MLAIGHQIHVMQRLVFGAVRLVADFDAAQIFHPRHALDAGDDEAQRIAVFWTQHFAVHAVGNHDVVKRIGEVHSARHAAAVRALGEDELRLLHVDAAVVEQPFQRHARELAAGEHAVRVLHRRHCDVAPFHTRVRTAFDEVHARNRRHTHQVVHRVDLGLFDQTVDHETVLRRVDVPPALVVALKVQAARRDDAEEALQWREAHACSADAREARRFAALQVFFVLRRQAVSARCHWLAKAFGVRGQIQNGGIAVLSKRFGQRQRTCCAASGEEGFAQETAAIVAWQRHRVTRQEKLGGLLKAAEAGG